MELPREPWIWVLSAGVVGLLVSEWSRSRSGIWLFKPLASAGFVLGGWLAYERISPWDGAPGIGSGAVFADYSAFVVAGLILSWVGDVLLIPKRKEAFLAGIGAFLLAHVAYAGAFGVILLNGKADWPMLGAGLAVVAPTALIAARVFVPRVKGLLRKAVPAYIGVISLMVLIAFASGLREGVAAAVCFFVSDLSVARHRFVKESFMNKLWGLPLYYLAQLLFVRTVAQQSFLGLEFLR